ncbi:DUF4393 domain-containing protein [Citrobacter freundii]|uniref:DUF4393 domain-containing protein n=1 Tax=Citrobacter freundii TaxID=546 RepID=UPI0021633D8A|nr:DUF4393 domain-containing protein [Citrobacter freundii]MCS0562695.1 DUF4393 domain-containing protein [Citrobacter freundii]
MSDEKAESSQSAQSLTVTAQVAKDLMELAKNDENTVAASKNFGESAVIISKTVKNCLLPLAAVNYGIDKAKAYFEKTFKKDLEEKTQSIPAENIVEPKASIAGPALQGLAFSHEEYNLKEMYLNLISSSMNRDVANDAHPAFVEVIKQLTSDEAEMLQIYLCDSAPRVIGRVIYQQRNSSLQIDGNQNILMLQIGTEPYYDKYLPSYVDNWVRLGIVEVRYDQYLKEELYEPLKIRNEYTQDNVNYGDDFIKTLGKGLIRRTPFGAQFAAIVGITN